MLNIHQHNYYLNNIQMAYKRTHTRDSDSLDVILYNTQLADLS